MEKRSEIRIRRPCRRHNSDSREEQPTNRSRTRAKQGGLPQSENLSPRIARGKKNSSEQIKNLGSNSPSTQETQDPSTPRQEAPTTEAGPNQERAQNQKRSILTTPKKGRKERRSGSARSPRLAGCGAAAACWWCLVAMGSLISGTRSTAASSQSPGLRRAPERGERNSLFLRFLSATTTSCSRRWGIGCVCRGL